MTHILLRNSTYGIQREWQLFFLLRNSERQSPAMICLAVQDSNAASCVICNDTCYATFVFPCLDTFKSWSTSLPFPRVATLEAADSADAISLA
jgi:hypothetical protein